MLEQRRSTRGSRIQLHASDRNQQDNHDDTDHSGRLSNRIYNLTQKPAPFRDDSYSSDEYPRATDIFEGLGGEKADLYYDFDPRNLSPSNRTYEPLRMPSSYIDHTSHDRSFVNIGAAARSLEEALEEMKTSGYAASNEAEEEAEHLWRAEYPEGLRSRLRARLSFSKLHNKDTISRDSTIRNEAQMDDLLACVGKRMMKTPSLKESRDESPIDGEGLEGDTLGSRLHFPRANPPADLS
ncbi:hypothetical protein FCIRC_13338 [Fusarium circinatum]|uniref:Uncharacterized protein n=1 Tax=Fusarium circinatum TaxID=48490 RepID=A0A8H5WG60_FUSCI|nr:hypothetical protein FCIRC_13338 [Fusarium circinatum]